MKNTIAKVAESEVELINYQAKVDLLNQELDAIDVAQRIVLAGLAIVSIIAICL
jgi:hypothetical protein